MFFVDYFIYINDYKQSIEELESTYTSRLFSVNKVVVYSSANATTSNNSKSSLDISQFSDIAIYINNNSNEGFTNKNTIKELYINNIELSRNISWNS